MTLFLSLTSRSLSSLLDPSADPPRTLLDAPSFVSGEFGLRGLSLDADMLSGWSGDDMDRLRTRADQAACPVLVLVDHQILDIGSSSEEVRTAAIERLQRLAWAGSRLGCNSIAIRAGAADEDSCSQAADAIQEALVKIDSKELNLLLAPCVGRCAESEGLSELIKQIGGFRIGALPTYGDPESPEDPLHQIRKLAPYAGAVHLRCEGFKRSGAHRGHDLAEGLQAAVAVGYQSNIVIDYVGADDAAKNITKAVELLNAAIEAE